MIAHAVLRGPVQPWEDEELNAALTWLEGQLAESVRVLSRSDSVLCWQKSCSQCRWHDHSHLCWFHMCP